MLVAAVRVEQERVARLSKVGGQDDQNGGEGGGQDYQNTARLTKHTACFLFVFRSVCLFVRIFIRAPPCFLHPRRACAARPCYGRR